MKVRLNTALASVHGATDGYVYRSYRGKQFVQKKPVFTGDWGAGTVKQRGQFAAAAKWYETVVKPNPELVALYREKGKAKQLNYRQMALRDFFNPPEVLQVVDLSIRGGPQRLSLGVTDDFEVVRVTAVLRDDTSKVILETEVPAKDANFTLEVPPVVAGAKPPASIEVTAYDRPGNKTTKVFPLNAAQVR